MPIQGPKMEFLEISPLNISGYHRDPKSHLFARNRAFWCIDSKNPSTVVTCIRGEEKTKKEEKKVTNNDISHMHPDHPHRLIAHIFGS